MDPITGLGALSLFGGLVGSIASAGDAERQGREDAQAFERNARLARLAAMDAESRGAQEAGRARMKGTQVIGEQKVAFAASGVDVSSGSPLALMADSRMMSELDAQTLKNNAAREAWGLRMEADDLDKQAKRSRQRGRNSAYGALFGGIANFGAGAAGMYERGA